MKTVIIHGQNHEGSTCMAARELAQKVGWETEEFFLPRDFDEQCRGCYTCFNTDMTRCPHYKKLERPAKAILSADLLIFESPVYAYHATGQMKSFLDHFATWWIVHRPRPEMARKQAVVVATAAGGGMKSTMQDMADSLEMWGVRRVYRMGFGVQAAKPEQIPERIKERIHKKTDTLARRILEGADKCGYNARAKKWYYIVRMMHRAFPPAEPDYGYWESRGWHKKGRPWKSET